MLEFYNPQQRYSNITPETFPFIQLRIDHLTPLLRCDYLQTSHLLARTYHPPLDFLPWTLVPLASLSQAVAVSSVLKQHSSLLPEIYFTWRTTEVKNCMCTCCVWNKSVSCFAQIYCLSTSNVFRLWILPMIFGKKHSSTILPHYYLFLFSYTSATPDELPGLWPLMALCAGVEEGCKGSRRCYFVYF